MTDTSGSGSAITAAASSGNPYAMIIAAAVQAGSGIAGSIIGAAGSRRRERRLAYAQGKQMKLQAESMRDMAEKLDKMYKEGAITLEIGFKRLEDHFAEQGGMLNEWFQEQMSLGTQELQKNREMALSALENSLSTAERYADRQTRNVLEDKKRSIKELRKSFEQSNEQIKENFQNERLGASGAFIATMQKNQEGLGKIANELSQSSTLALNRIGKDFYEAVIQNQFQAGQAQQQFDLSSLGLQRELGGQLRQGQMALGQQQFGATEALTQQIFDYSQTGLRELAELQTGADYTEALGESLLSMGSASGSKRDVGK